MSLARAALRIAYRAARRWPLGRPAKAWFIRDALEPLFYCLEFPVEAGRAGDPAVCVATYYAVRAGRTTVGWRDVFIVQERLIELLLALGIENYNETLASDPGRIADLLASLLEEGHEDEGGAAGSTGEPGAGSGSDA